MIAPSGASPAREDDAAPVERSRLDPDRFTLVYDRYFPEIYRYVAARLGRDAVDDVAAETFYTAFRHRERFDPGRGEVRPWLYGIATRLVGQHRRDESRRYELLSRLGPGERAEEHEERAADRVTAQVLRPKLAAALAELSGEDRDVLLLTALAGLRYEEVAQVLEIPGGTVGSRLNHARRKVRRALGDIDPTRIEEYRRG